jgi:hypothetical protein
MKSSLILASVLALAGTAIAADTNLTATVQSALAKLNASTNYSWTTTIKMPGMPFEMSPMKGATEIGGYSKVSQEFNGNTTEAIFKGEKVVLKGEEGWQLPSEMEGFAGMMGQRLSRDGTAADEAAKLLKGVKELKVDTNGVISGDLTPETVKENMSFRRRGGDQPAPEPKNAKGTVQFWVKDNTLTKFESHVQGTIAFGPDQEERDMDTTRTVEIQNVGSTKVEVPDAAKTKLEAK